MINGIKVVVVISSLLVFAPLDTRANQAGYSIDELSNSADVIVLGTARSVSKNPAIESYGTKVVAISFAVDECFKCIQNIECHRWARASSYKRGEEICSVSSAV